MRLALIALACTGLSACGEKAENAAPEQRAAPGEVLGGEVTDDMLPTDTVRSTSPVDPRGSSTATGDDEPPAVSKTRDSPANPLPRPILSGGAPMPDMNMPADPEPRRTDGE